MSCPGTAVEDADGSSEEEFVGTGVSGGVGAGGVGAGGGGGAGATPLPTSDKVVGEERLALMIEILPDMVPFDCGRKDTWNTCC